MSASSIGLLATVHSISQFFFIRSGGPLADRLPNRWLIVGGMGLQVLVMAYFALLPGNVSLLWVVVGSIANGLGAGISLAAMHRTALSDIPDRQTGSAAGTYSMTRFAGSLLSTAMAGVLLQNRLDAGVATLTAYQIVYASLAVVGVFGILLASRLRN
jgi:MFS family permease